MGHLTRTYDWAQTSLGPPNTWPQSLQITMGILLHSSFPMFLFWGDDLICFYNDAYRPSLGINGKHPALGKPGKEVWPEIWDFIGPLIEQVTTMSEPVWFEDQLLPIYRNGQLEDVYWTFSYSPAYGDDGTVSGVFVACTETTDKVRVINKLRHSEQRFQNLVRDASVGIIVLDGEAMTVNIVNDAYARLIDRTCEELMGKPLFSIIPEVEEPFRPMLDTVRLTGKPFYHYSQPYSVHNAADEAVSGFLDLVGQPYKEHDGTITGVIVLCQDVTEQNKAEQALGTSENMFRNVTSSSPAGLWLSDQTGGLTYLNSTLVEWTGLPYDNLLGAGWASAIIEEDRQQSTNAFLTAVTTRTHYDVLFRLSKSDGSICWCRAAGDPFYDEGGNYAGYAGFCMDVDELILARQKVEHTEAALRGAIELAELGTWQIDLTTGTLDYSERLRGWFGIGNDEVITVERAYQPVSAMDRPRIQAAISHAITRGTDGIYDIEYAINPTEAGRERIVHIQGKAFVNEKGEAYKLSGTAQDVTEQRNVQHELERLVTKRTQQLQESVNDLQRSNNNLQQFAYVASHDLQEPLRKIQSFSDMLRNQYKEELGESGNDYLLRMQASASRMSVLIKDLLTYSRISTQQDSSATVSLTSVINAVLADLDLAIQETVALVRVDSLPTVQGDKSQLGQLFQNLLNNALKFRKTGQTPQISITCQTIAATDLPPSVWPTREAIAYYRIDVADNGIGFDEQYVDRIFQVFQRLHGRSQFAGTGIGLAICEKVTANHGGAITASSQPGEGAIFSVYLPTYPYHPT